MNNCIFVHCFFMMFILVDHEEIIEIVIEVIDENEIVLWNTLVYFVNIKIWFFKKNMFSYNVKKNKKTLIYWFSVFIFLLHSSLSLSLVYVVMDGLIMDGGCYLHFHLGLNFLLTPNSYFYQIIIVFALFNSLSLYSYLYILLL